MGKAPASWFYWNDYYRDTRPLTKAARGVWMDILCFLHQAPTRGVLRLSPVGWGQVTTCTPEEFAGMLDEFRLTRICKTVTHGNGDVTLMSRRMLREEKAKQSLRLRVSKHREKRASNAEVTNCNNALQSSSSSSLRLQKDSEKKEPPLSGSQESAVTRNGSPPKRASAFPSAWTVEPWMVELCGGFRLNAQNVFAEFRDYHLAKGTVFKSWPHAFRTWVNKAIEFKQRR